MAWLNRFLRYAAVLLWIAVVSVPTAQAETATPALWRLADHDSEIWLFGTMHLLPPGMVWRTKRFDAAFAAADTVYLETDILGVDPDRMQALMLEFGQNRNFITLTSLLDPADGERLARVAGKLSIPPSGLEPLRPWLAAVTLSVAQIIAQGFDPASGVDRTIAAMADAVGKRLGFFESAEQQIQILASLDAAAEKAFLKASLELIESENDYLSELVQAWATGDSKRLEQLFKQTVGGDFTELLDAIFFKRNRAWTVQIARIMDGSGKVLIAVGAGHLPGEQGVVAMLRAKGFVVTRQ